MRNFHVTFLTLIALAYVWANDTGCPKSENDVIFIYEGLRCEYNITESLVNEIEIYDQNNWNQNGACTVKSHHQSHPNHGGFHLFPRLQQNRYRQFFDLCIDVKTKLQIDEVVVKMSKDVRSREGGDRYCLINNLKADITTQAKDIRLGCFRQNYMLRATGQRFIQLELIARKGKTDLFHNEYTMFIPDWEMNNEKDHNKIPCEFEPLVISKKEKLHGLHGSEIYNKAYINRVTPCQDSFWVEEILVNGTTKPINELRTKRFDSLPNELWIPLDGSSKDFHHHYYRARHDKVQIKTNV